MLVDFTLGYLGFDGVGFTDQQIISNYMTRLIYIKWSYESNQLYSYNE